MREEDKKEIETTTEIKDTATDIKETINLLGVVNAKEYGGGRGNSKLLNIEKLKEIRNAVKKTTYGIIEVPNGNEGEFFKSCGVNGVSKTQFVNKINTTNRIDGLRMKAKLNNGNIKVMTW